MRVLITDDDKNLRTVLKSELSGERMEVDVAENGPKTMDLLENDEYDVLVLDLSMPGLSGMDVLQKIKALGLTTEVVMLTGYGTVSTAVEAMRLGAYDFLTKPFQVLELKTILEKAYEKRMLSRENVMLKTGIQRESEAQKIITESPLMFGVLEHVKKLALSHLPVLVLGESGVGKELIARAIHHDSERADRPFVPINCGAIPETMLESELFGFEKGAFTGAHARKPGLLEVANQGTLFLDEICELPLSLQGKLLRVIETGRFFRIGGVKEIQVDVKFISASNRDVKSEAENGRFRSDLYYRVSALSLSVPPLRERKEDVPLLVGHVMKQNAAFKNKSFSKEALKILTDYTWPGNVRELLNVVHRTLLLSQRDRIEAEDFPPDLIANPAVSGKRLEDVERAHILRVLKEMGGQKGKAAEVLGVDPKTLYRKLLNYGINDS